MNFETHDREGLEEAETVAVQRLLDPKGPKAVILRRQNMVVTADFDAAVELKGEGWVQTENSPRLVGHTKIYFLESPDNWDHSAVIDFLEAHPPVLPPLSPPRRVSHNLLGYTTL